MARYGFATLLGDYPVGYEFAPDNIPLYLTHVDSFEVDLNHNPHVSIYDTRRVEIGQEVMIKDVSIGVKTGDGVNAVHKIVATVASAGDEPRMLGIVSV